jgi:hypothetical protein
MKSKGKHQKADSREGGGEGGGGGGANLSLPVATV